MKRTSINDIAKKVGVSKTLVSFVLNGKAKEFRISDEICKKVQDAAKEMNYQPNRLAQSLRTGKTNTIGLIIADIANPFFGILGREIEQEAAKSGYRIIFCSSDENPEKSKQQIGMLQQSQVDGYIISPPMYSEDQVFGLVKNNVPLVLIYRFFPEIDSNYVGINNFEAAYKAATHLIKLGRKRIACISVNKDMINMRERTDGYRQALVDGNLEVDENLVKVLTFSHDNKELVKALKELFGKKENRKADAILFSTSKLGIMGIEYISSLGINIPHDVAVVSFDNPDAYKICISPVTVVNQPLKEIGKTAVQVLLNKIKHPEAKSQQIILKTEFIIRKSCGS